MLNLRNKMFKGQNNYFARVIRSDATLSSLKQRRPDMTKFNVPGESMTGQFGHITQTWQLVGTAK